MVHIDRLSFAFVLALAAPAHADASGVISVQLTALHSNRGHAGCTLYRGPNGFPKDANAALQRVWCGIASGVAVCRFDPVPAGTYAVACFHDENDNQRLDTGMFGIPSEGTVVSNRAKGSFGPPKYDDAKFSFSGAATELALPMSY